MENGGINVSSIIHLIHLGKELSLRVKYERPMGRDVPLDIGVWEPNPGQEDQQHGEECGHVEAGDHIVGLSQHHHKRTDETHGGQGEAQGLIATEKRRK